MKSATITKTWTRSFFRTQLRAAPVSGPPLGVGGDFGAWFYITKAGMAFHQSDDTWWPFGNQDD